MSDLLARIRAKIGLERVLLTAISYRMTRRDSVRSYRGFGVGMTGGKGVAVG